MLENKDIKVVFFGSSKFAVPILKSLYENFDLKAVVTQPDQPAGRGRLLTQTPVSIFSESLTDIPLYKYENLNDENVKNQLKKYEVDLFIVAAYGKIISLDVLNIPKFGSLNFHGSILPKYRGASPIQESLKNGDHKTGVTLIKMDEKMDHGDVISLKVIEITDNDNFFTLEDKLGQIAFEMCLNDLKNYVNGVLIPHPQNHEMATYVKLITKEAGRVNWNNTAHEIMNLWRAYIQWPGIYTTVKKNEDGDIILKFDQIAVSSNVKELKPGEILLENKKVFIGTGSGVVEVISITPQSKKTMLAADFANGFQSLNHSMCK